MDFRRQQMPFVKSLEDLGIIWEIGFHQEADHPLTLQLLFRREIGTVATIQRRLSRLKRLGVVRQSRATHDKRLVTLMLDPALLRKLNRLSLLFK